MVRVKAEKPTTDASGSASCASPVVSSIGKKKFDPKAAVDAAKAARPAKVNPIDMLRLYVIAGMTFPGRLVETRAGKAFTALVVNPPRVPSHQEDKNANANLLKTALIERGLLVLRAAMPFFNGADLTGEQLDGHDAGVASIRGYIFDVGNLQHGLAIIALAIELFGNPAVPTNFSPHWFPSVYSAMNDPIAEITFFEATSGALFNGQPAAFHLIRADDTKRDMEPLQNRLAHVGFLFGTVRFPSPDSSGFDVVTAGEFWVKLTGNIEDVTNSLNELAIQYTIVPYEP